MIEYIIIGILIILLAVSVYGNINQVRAQEKKEDYINELEDINKKYTVVYKRISDLVRGSRKKLNELDDIGAFEADDSVGYFFKMLKTIQDEIEENIY